MKAKELVMRFVKDESGLETVEYAVMVGLIVIAIIAAITLLKNSIVNAFTTVANVVSPPPAPAS